MNPNNNYAKRYDENRLNAARVQVLDHLLERGHSVNKALVNDLAYYIYDISDALYAQGYARGKVDTAHTLGGPK